MSASCKYRNDLYGYIETLTCEFGCCEHGCCTEEQMNDRKVTSAELGLCIGVPVALSLLLFILVKIIVYYCQQRKIKQQAAFLKQLNEASRPSPTIIIHIESDVGQSRPQGGEHELPVAQSVPAYEDGTKVPPSLEKAIVHSLVARHFGKGHSGYQRFENE
ncbi:uncharacterized protein LOC127870369 [Dreissena polymorpha]|uniref:CX domain-containing protein n=1 Tax=Dreissena polymorpha TaxID=45954 RepID=A0A9D4RIW6_DREPO|nr:uncharacterized protein LOC127870369 [Dreissena polymorpha]KAH3869939.1 hypothetical protein DPMN_033117 [Dreissena polymorpha]